MRIDGSPFSGIANADVFGREDPADLGSRIVEIAGDDRVLGAHDHARRLETEVRSVRAIVALRGGARPGVDVNGIVRAGLKAGLTADAAILIELHDAIMSLVHRGHRTDPNARWIGAVVTAGDLEVAADVRVLADFGVFDPGAVHAERNLVFAFAGRRAGVAADARPVVDDETEIGHGVTHSKRHSRLWSTGLPEEWADCVHLVRRRTTI